MADDSRDPEQGEPHQGRAPVQIRDPQTVAEVYGRTTLHPETGSGSTKRKKTESPNNPDDGRGGPSSTGADGSSERGGSFVSYQSEERILNSPTEPTQSAT